MAVVPNHKQAWTDRRQEVTVIPFSRQNPALDADRRQGVAMVPACRRDTVNTTQGSETVLGSDSTICRRRVTLSSPELPVSPFTVAASIVYQQHEL